MTTRRLSWRLSILFVAFASALGAAPRPKADPAVKSRRRIHAHRLEGPIELDGRVVEPAWGRIEPATDFVQQMPAEGEISTERTEVRIAYDEDNLYFGVICFDSDPSKILVSQNKRDGDMIESDSFQILLDTFGDGQNAFVFGTNPRGIEFDGQVTKAGQSGGGSVPTRGQPSSSSGVGAIPGGSTSRSSVRGPTGRSNSSSFNVLWDGVWQVRTQITERGWEAEFAIPFKTLRFARGSNGAPRSPDQNHSLAKYASRPWGVNFMRNLRRRNEQAYWSPISRAHDLYRVSLAGQLVDLQPRLHRSARFTPYALGGVRQDFTTGADSTSGVHRVGGDLKYTLTSSLTLDGTYNTDFAQVEVDEEQINLTRFNLFYPEKRPFFLENSGIFEFGTPREVEVFFSRRIGISSAGAEIPLHGGARVTGKLGRFSIGLLDMETKSVDPIPGNNFAVGRVRREFGRRSAVGGILVARNARGHLAGESDRNATYGVDATLGFGEKVTVFSYLARSSTPGRNGRDHAGRFELEYLSRKIEGRAGYTQVGEDFNPEVGFLKRSGYRKAEYGLWWNPRPKWGPVRRLNPHVTGEQYLGFDGDRQSGTAHHDFRVEFKDGSEISIARNYYFERPLKTFTPFAGVSFAPGPYRFSEWAMVYTSNQSATAFWSGSLAVGPFYSGRLRTSALSGGVRRGSNFLVSFRYVRNDIDLGARSVASNLAGLRVNYSLSPKSYVQSLVQYNNQVHQLSGNFRFAYLLTSSTGLFVVYNTHFDMLDRTFGEEFQRRTLDRVFLVKFSYLFGI
jgi:hypothetical protein